MVRKKEKFKASFKNGVLRIHPHTERDADGNLTIHALNPEVEQRAKNEILMKMAKGEKVDFMEL